MKYLLFIFSLFHATTSLGQDNCLCPKHKLIEADYTDAFRTYNLSEEITVGYCGFTQNLGTEAQPFILFSEGVFFECRSKSILYSLDALEVCTIKKKNDTLVISKLYSLPIDVNYNIEKKPFFITKLYVENNEIKKQHYFLTSSNNYTKKQIEGIIQRYKTTTSRTYEWNSLQYLDICYQLFWCYVSGSNEALLYLKKARIKFGGFSGHFAEEYNDLLRTCREIQEYNK